MPTIHPYRGETSSKYIVDTFYIHNCLGSMFHGILNWFSTDFYPRFEYKVMGSYDKSVEFFNKERENSTNKPSVPSITLDPAFDFLNEDRGGRFLWQHSRYAPNMGKRLFKPIDLSEQDIYLNPVFSRYQGQFELIFWLSSVYELFDFRTSLLQFCGGTNRWCRPDYFWSYLILPDVIANYENENGESIDWGNTHTELVHVDTINDHKLAVPFPIDVMWKLDSSNDASTKYGGDRISEHKMSATFSYEVNLPTYMVLSRSVNVKVQLNFSVGKTYSQYPVQSPFTILTYMKNTGMAEDYIASDNFAIYTFIDVDTARENLVTKFTSSTVNYPDKIQEWDHHAAGRLISLDEDLPLMSDFERSDIAVFNTYRDEFLSYIRKCKLVISKDNAKNSELMYKCQLLKKPLLSNLNDVDMALINARLNQNVTIDVYTDRLYDGLHLTNLFYYKDKTAGAEVITKIKENDPELYEKAIKEVQDATRNWGPYEMMAGPESYENMKKIVVYENCDGIKNTFDLAFVISGHVDADHIKIYVDEDIVSENDYEITNGDTLVFDTSPYEGSSVYLRGYGLILRDSKIEGIYEFTDSDYTNINPLVICLPKNLERSEDLIMVSYSGKMIQGKDYDLDLERQEATIYLTPKEDEIIQFHYYSVPLGSTQGE